MKALYMAIVIGSFAACVLGRRLSSASPKSCEFPHEGNGGVLDQNGGYINESVLVWVDVANNCFTFVSNQRGVKALESWIESSNRFNTAMEEGNEDAAFKMLHQANNSFKSVAPYVCKADLSKYFMKVYGEFGALLEAKNLGDINNYMIGAYPQFIEKLNCQKSHMMV